MFPPPRSGLGPGFPVRRPLSSCPWTRARPSGQILRQESRRVLEGAGGGGQRCGHRLCAPQMVITASQIQWTADVTKCLLTAKERGDKKILKVMKKKQVGGLQVRGGPAGGWRG